MKIDTLHSTFALMVAGILWGILFTANMTLTSGIIAYIFSIPFMVTVIVELNNSDRIDKREKTMWTFGFIGLTLITAILYFISQRKRVLPVEG